MEGQQVRGAENGRDEYHDIPNDNLGTPSKLKTGRQGESCLFFSGQYERMEVGLG